MRFLVAGASSGFGLMLANTLQGKGHDVQTMQRTPGPGFGDLEHDEGGILRRWNMVDFLEPQAAVAMMSQWVAEEVRFDGVVVCTRRAEKKLPSLVNVFDLQEHYTVNLFSPILLVSYMARYGVLKPRAPAIFFLDPGPYPDGCLAYRLSKAGLEQSVRAFFTATEFPGRFYFVRLPRDTVGQDMMTETLARVLDGKFTPPSDVLTGLQ
jgi:NAD(P)-dependent dehydrogenase (short-subunit alcohol dehydrogenase family)